MARAFPCTCRASPLLEDSTCFDAPGRRRALLQSSDEAEALASAQAEANVCDDTHFPSTLALFRYGKQTEEWDRLLQYEGTGAADGVLDYGGARHSVRTFKFKNAEFTTEGSKLYNENR